MAPVPRPGMRKRPEILHDVVIVIVGASTGSGPGVQQSRPLAWGQAVIGRRHIVWPLWAAPRVLTPHSRVRLT